MYLYYVVELYVQLIYFSISVFSAIYSSVGTLWFSLFFLEFYGACKHHK
jgi:magnesium-transporting ATPase (P-type)